MLCFPNAKVNIGLNVVEKRADGFHNLETVFYPVHLSDVLEIGSKPSSGEAFQSSGLSIPADGDNLCVKAYHLLQKDYQLPPIAIHLHKIVPIGAGLGGGSSDAAFTIQLLNDIYKLEIPKAKMQAYAAQLGSDCAFFIENRPMFATGKGDELEEITLDLSAYHIVIVKPELSINTAAAYSMIQPKASPLSLKEAIEQPLEAWRHCIFNDFEVPIFNQHTELQSIKDKLYTLGADYASMSGSGSAIFGIFEQTPDEAISKQFEDCFVWHGKLAVEK